MEEKKEVVETVSGEKNPDTRESQQGKDDGVILADASIAGKICPFCKTEIKENEETIVCPSCNTPHHKGCWTENKGCTTFGCVEQHYEEQHTNPTDVCSNCGAPLGDGQAFCPKCGTRKEEKKSFCGKCGAELQPGQEFCPKCGQKANLQIEEGVASAISQFNSNVEREKKKPNKIIIIAASFAGLLILLVLCFALVKTPADYMRMGNYKKAYSSASDSEKNAVIIENNIAVCSADCVDSLKDSKSFDLRDAWCNCDEGYVVLKVAGNNSYGNTVINYWLFTFSDSKQKWSLFDTYTDLDREESSYWDSSDEKLEKAVHNLGISYIESTMKSSYKLDSDGVKRINDLFADDLLNKVEQISEAVPKS